jgi:predicted enzyme related to lactoylglutathione lyase
MATRPAPFIWHELTTSDVAAAKAFYADVIGWQMQTYPPGGDYTVLSVGGRGVAGMLANPPELVARGVPPCWTGYLHVENVDACVARILATGGAVQRPADDIPNVGRFAVVADPQGAVFIVFTPGSSEPMPEVAPGTRGLVGWNELMALDMPKAFDWYADVFGWTQVEDMDMGPMGTYRLFATGAGMVGGMMTKMPEMPGPFWSYYFNVDALDAALERTVKGGGKVLNGPQEVPGPMYVANCMDPQGAGFSMVAPRR